MSMLQKIIQEDAGEVAAELASFGAYGFAEELRRSMERLPISANALAARLGTSHTAVGKWLSGAARPKDREEVKRIGMALELDEEALGRLLLLLHYPALYAKNPYDGLCLTILATAKDEPTPDSPNERRELAARYKQAVEKFGLERFGALAAHKRKAGTETIATNVVRRDLAAVHSEDEFNAWLLRHAAAFGSDGTHIRSKRDLVLYLKLFLSDETIHEMYVTEQIPISVRNMLYEVKNSSAGALKFLRSKLIVFGLYKNMAVPEIDRLLFLARLPILSKPVDRLDAAVLLMVRKAHLRYPHYENESLTDLVTELGYILSGLRSKDMGRADKNDFMRTFYEPLLAEYKERLHTAGTLAAEYESAPRTAERSAFESAYTNYDGHFLADYAADILVALVKNGALLEKEAKDFRAHLRVG